MKNTKKTEKNTKTIRVFKFDMKDKGEGGKTAPQIAVFLDDAVIEDFPKVAELVRSMSRKHRLTVAAI